MEYIIFYIPNLGKGGAERILVNVANKIANDYGDKYKVMIALSNKEGFYLNYVDSKVDIIAFHSKHVSRSLFGLVKLIRFYRYEKLHLFSFLGYANIIAIIASYLSFCRSKIDLIVSERNHIPWDDDIRSRIVYVLQKMLYKKCDAVVAISKAISKEIVEKLNVKENKVHTIFNPLTSALVNNSDDKVQFDHDEVNIVTAGRLIPIKDFPLLIRAFFIVCKENKARLWILGDGPEKGNLIELSEGLGIKNRVEFCGFVDSPIDYFKEADMYVCSSKSEGFANVVLEAMAAGTRIVSMSCGGPDEILEDGKWGTIVYKRQPEVLAEAMIRTIGLETIDYEERLKIFKLESVVEQYVLVLRPQKA